MQTGEDHACFILAAFFYKHISHYVLIVLIKMTEWFIQEYPVKWLYKCAYKCNTLFFTLTAYTSEFMQQMCNTKFIKGRVYIVSINRCILAGLEHDIIQAG